ncbi:hypothetical protein FNH13_02885 [Ornithinimicrobium ciconiae]|uniref:Uncharacterized protein n=1 Tax=Ornithinimicrobium ciconiae TaxID=2594265 RepID=A0A516G7B1_9MICO|nr:hypothetical protein [Ornithinimicrobium ciconiae]QDO87408.1 hypothetical protein FNH13_02885 [Ornithinimicrobium ciconiae]
MKSTAKRANLGKKIALSIQACAILTNPDRAPGEVGQGFYRDRHLPEDGGCTDAGRGIDHLLKVTRGEAFLAQLLQEFIAVLGLFQGSIGAEPC